MFLAAADALAAATTPAELARGAVYRGNPSDAGRFSAGGRGRGSDRLPQTQGLAVVPEPASLQ